ncbi:MAG: lysylphosphatidylglycerol synthase transmembrane domain-containing protein [Mycoplasma sp.]
MILDYLNKKIIHPDASQGNYFTKKKILAIALSSSVLVVAIVLSFVLMDINIPLIWSMMVASIKAYPWIGAILLVALLLPIFKSMYIFSYIHPRLKSFNIHVSSIEYIALFAKITLLNAITPFTNGAEPYTLYWLKTRGMTLQNASILLIVNAIVSMGAEILITIPAIVTVSMFYGKLVVDGGGALVFWFMITGLLINIIVFGFYLTVAFSRKIHYRISLISNWFLKKTKQKHLTKDQIYHKYMIEIGFKGEVKKLFKNWKYLAGIFISYLLMTIFYYNTVCLSFIILNPHEDSIRSFVGYLNFFNIANIAITANAFIPVPGGEGTVQVSIVILAKALANLNLENGAITQTVGFWRILTNYFPMILSMSVIFVYYTLKILIIKKEAKESVPLETK